MKARILDLGDTALTVEFGHRIDPALLAKVAALDHACQQAMVDGRLPGVIETVPTFRSLTLTLDPLTTRRQTLRTAIETLLNEANATEKRYGGLWHLPVCYEGDCGPDLDHVARETGLRRDEIIAQHSDREYLVYMLGFLPGFPFMGDLAPELQLPRRSQPRTRVPRGSVAIANALTAIYPWESPGGWHLLGNCPLPLFDRHVDPPALLAPGDRVRFIPVSQAEHDNICEAVDNGTLDVRTWSDQHASTA